MTRLLFLLFLLILSSCEQNTVPPEEAARKFCLDLGLKLRGSPSCTAIDTDHDGYVTCTVAIGTDDSPRLWSLQCAALTRFGETYAVGCKETQPKILIKDPAP
jgi:hypothetical protein